MMQGQSQSDLLLVAYDLRGHGKTVGHADLEIDKLVDDARFILEHYMNLFEGSIVNYFLVGHSLGGSIVSRLSAAADLKEKISGIIVIDIVEEAALQALLHMPAVLERRPRQFALVEDAVEWALKSGTCKSREVAEISFLSQYHEAATGGGLELIVDLRTSEACWTDWFTNLSQTFLALPCPKMLVLAETDYLDRTLLVGQMQGKFWLEVVRGTGHAIQEDQPKKLAALLLSFIDRSTRKI